ncbi:hypothetical protein [Brevibacillus borstelensis]|uniref:hypothetical protein n=1 Tax=Brevibacillus borstelensis TaxID=45462 RepID=UPI0030BB8DE9
MEKIPLLQQKEDGNSKATWVPIKDILLFKAAKHGYAVYAKSEKEESLRTFHILEDWMVLLKPYGFERTDVGNIINISEAKHYVNKQVYFDDVLNTESPVFGTVSKPNFKRLESFLKTIKRD